jgi:Transcriptional regulatory protein, C terminal
MAHSTVVQGIDGQPRIDVRVLGPFEVSTGGRRIDISSGRLRVLLAVLAMSAGQSVSVERLADAMWGEDLPENVRRTIQTYVTRLRQTLGAEAIETDAGGYLLRARPDDVDELGDLDVPDLNRELLLDLLASLPLESPDGAPSESTG